MSFDVSEVINPQSAITRLEETIENLQEGVVIDVEDLQDLLEDCLTTIRGEHYEH